MAGEMNEGGGGRASDAVVQGIIRAVADAGLPPELKAALRTFLALLTATVESMNVRYESADAVQGALAMRDEIARMFRGLADGLARLPGEGE